MNRTGAVVQLPGLRTFLSDVQFFKLPAGIRPLLAPGDEVTTGTVIDVVDSADQGWTARVAVVAAIDTQKDRTWWRLRTAKPEAHPYSFLWTSGRRSGYISGPTEGCARGPSINSPGDSIDRTNV